MLTGEVRSQIDAIWIRHPILDEATVITLTDARFMLVVCSAFANFLIDAVQPTP